MPLKATRMHHGYMKALVAIMWFLLSIWQARGQLPLRFVHYNENSGLSHYQAWSIFQDSRGFYWIGTTDGLNRYDGGRFTAFFHEEDNPQSLCGNVVIGVVENSKHQIIVGTTDGLSVFHPESNSFTTVFRSSSTESPDNIIQFITEDDQDRLWLIYRHHIVVINAAFEPIKTLQLSAQLNQDIYRIQQDYQGRMWLNVGQKIVCIDTEKDFQLHDGNNDSNPLFQSEIADFDFDSSGNIVIADLNTSVLRTHTLSGEFIEQSAPAEKDPLPCERLFVAPSGKKWIVSRDNGLYCYADGTWVNKGIRHNPDLPASICSDQVKSIVEDSYGNTWFCCDAGLDVVFENSLGVRFLFQENDPGLDPNHPMQINAVFSDSTHTLLATWGRGLASVNRSTGNATYFTPGADADNLFMNDIIPIGRDIFVGNFAGYFRFDPQKGKFTSIDLLKPAQNSNQRYPIFNIEEATDGELFISSNENKGLLIYDLRIPKADYYSQDSIGAKNFPLRHFSAMTQLPDGRIILGYNRSKGLVLFDKGSKHFTMLTGKDLLAFDDQVNCMMSRDSFLWIGNNHGLHRINIHNGSRVRITRSNGLPVNIVNAITMDADGFIWVGTRNGVSRLHPTNLGIINYSLNALSTDENVNGITFNEHLGCFEAFTDRMYVQFLPSTKAEKIGSAPEITFCSLGNRYLLPDARGALEISENDRMLSIAFACPLNPALANVYYEYKLVGLDADWISTDATSSITYSSLPAGTFNLSIRASVDGVNWIESKQPFTVHVRPMFYKRLGFIFSAGLMIVLFVLFTIQRRKRIRLKNLLAIQEVRNRIAADLHDDIGSTLSSISILSEVALHKLPQEPTKTRSMLVKIGEQSRALISEMSDMVWSINPENDNFESIGLRMRDYAASMVREGDIQCELILPENEHWPKMDMRTRRNLFLIYKEAIHNVMKHANCSTLVIRVHIVDQAVVMTISDNGSGFSMTTDKTGNGLKNMQKRAAQIGAELQIITSVGQGTTLKLKTK